MLLLFTSSPEELVLFQILSRHATDSFICLRLNFSDITQNLKSSVDSPVLFCISGCGQMVSFSSVMGQMSRAVAVTETM